MKESKYKEEAEELAEHMNTISEVLLGYREGTHQDILLKIFDLKEKAEGVEIRKNVAQFIDAVDDLRALCDDIRSDA